MLPKTKSSTQKNTQAKGIRTRPQINPIAFIEARSTTSMRLTLLQKLIPKISELIYSESPDASLKISKTTRCPTVKQINECRNNIAGFGNLAIPLVMKYQDALNLLVDKLEDASKTRLTMKGFFPNPNELEEDTLESIKIIIKKILNQEEELDNVEEVLKKLPSEIDDLITKFITQWKEHEQKFTEELIRELEAELGSLSDAEKMAILNKTKTISEIKDALKKANINISDTKTFGQMSNFKLRAIDAIVSRLNIQLKQDSINNTNISKILNKLRSIKNEKNAADAIVAQQKTEYKSLNTNLKDSVKKMEKLTLTKDRQTLVGLYNAHQASLKKAAALEKAEQARLEYDD